MEQIDNLKEFVDIPGYERLYKINKNGEIWSCKRNRLKILTADKDGYLTVGLRKNNKSKTYKVHRLVALVFILNPNNKPEVNHKDEIKTNNCIANLEWVTGAENFKHSERKIRNAVAKRHRKVSFLEAEEIRKLYKTNQYYQSDLGKMFNIGYKTIGQIIHYQRYAVEVY